jgi:hypothetical protein
MTAFRPRRGIAVMELVVVALIVIVLLAIAIPRFTRPTLDLVSGPAASVAPGATGALAVRVTSWRGAALADVPVVFEPGEGMAVTPTTARTDSSGVATATWFAGPAPGERTIVAHLEGRLTPSVRIAVRATAPRAPAVAPPSATPAAAETTRAGSAAPGTTPPATGRPAPTPSDPATPRPDSAASPR